MALQQVPTVATEYATLQRAENAAAVAAVRRLWNRIGDDFTPGFLAVAPQMFEVMNTAQVRISENAQAYIPDVLEATGQARYDKPSFDVSPHALMGVAGDGLPTETLAYGAVTHAKTAIGKGSTIAEALNAGGNYLSLAMGTMLSDTRRGMEGLESASRPVTGYVRMLVPPSCGRCVILAGKRTRRSQAFLRHPGCDCANIPSAESIAGSLTVDTDAYLGNLTNDELSRTLGSRANALAYREYGADSRQLINAYRKGGYVRPAQITRGLIVNGKPVISRLTVKATIEGVTVRSLAYQQMANVRALSQVAKTGGRYRTVTAPRLMPESIIGLGLPKERTAQMLRDFGWLGGSSPRMAVSGVSRRTVAARASATLAETGQAVSAENVASRMVLAATEAEPQLTSMVAGFAERFGGKMDGLDFRLKSVSSLTRKIEGGVAAGKGTAVQIADGMFDINRYTTVYSEVGYSKSVQATLDGLRAEGATLNVKNYWTVGKNPYQGVNVQVTTSSAQKFELQFHTETSLAVKEGEMHSVYELQRVELDVAKREAYAQQMFDISAKIPVPHGIGDVG